MCGPNCAAEAPATYLLYIYDMYMTPPPTPRLAYGRSSKGVEKWFHFYGHVCVCVRSVQYSIPNNTAVLGNWRKWVRLVVGYKLEAVSTDFWVRSNVP